MKKAGLIAFWIIILLGIGSLYKLNSEYEQHKSDLAIIEAKKISNAPQNNPLKKPIPTKVIKTDKFNIVVSSSSYEPNTIKVNKNDLVDISLYSKEGYHNFAVNLLGIHSNPLATGKKQNFHFIATESGTFTFHSDTDTFYQSSPVGTLIVQ